MPSQWPPADFRLVVEELSGGSSAMVVRRFAVHADGICVYALAPQTISADEAGVELPLFRSVCAYRLREENTRLLARKLDQRRILQIEGVQGDQRDVEGTALRISYRAFGNERLIVASGQIHGPLVRVLHAINAYLPAGHTFELRGMLGEPDESNLSGVPQPVDDLVGALECHQRLLELRGRDPDVVLAAFALACRLRERRLAEGLLDRWTEITGLASTPEAPFLDAPRVTRVELEALLPG